MGRIQVIGLGLLALPLCACKPKSRSDEPGRDVRSWTLAEIEAELARNDEVLAGEGIVVAMATPPTHAQPPYAEAPNEPPPATEPVPHEEIHAGEPEPSEQPQLVAPETAPTVAVEPSAAYEAGVASADEPADRRSRRRMATRDRREASTRCERICALAEATCDLETQICQLATTHPDEPRYAQACERAEQQCTAASEACQRCEE